jgi:hypothetical protein
MPPPIQSVRVRPSDSEGTFWRLVLTSLARRACGTPCSVEGALAHIWSSSLPCPERRAFSDRQDRPCSPSDSWGRPPWGWF